MFFTGFEHFLPVVLFFVKSCKYMKIGLAFRIKVGYNVLVRKMDNINRG